MNILHNFKNFLICFSIIFSVSFLYYLGKTVYIYHGVPGTTYIRYLFLMLVFLRDYFFPLSVMASMLSILFIAGTVKFEGGISIIATLLIISFVGVLYPVAVRYISYPLTDDILPTLPVVKDVSVSVGNIQIIDDAYIYVENIEQQENTYKNVLAASAQVENRSLGVSETAYENTSMISLSNADVLNANTRNVDRMVEYNVEKPDRIKLNVLEIFFAVPLLPYFNDLFTFFTSERIPYYIYLILFAALFLFLMGIYLLGSTFCVDSYKYHNILTAFMIYIIILLLSFFVFYKINSLYTLKNIFTYLGYLRLSFIILALSIFINMLAFAFLRILKFNKYYKE